MLYDNKRWDRQLKKRVNRYTLPSLIVWLEQKPAEAVYCYEDSGGCLLSQYFGSKVGHVYVVKSGRRIPAGFDGIASQLPHTFGAALGRARKIAFSKS